MGEKYIVAEENGWGATGFKKELYYPLLIPESLRGSTTNLPPLFFGNGVCIDSP